MWGNGCRGVGDQPERSLTSPKEEARDNSEEALDLPKSVSRRPSDKITSIILSEPAQGLLPGRRISHIIDHCSFGVGLHWGCVWHKAAGTVSLSRATSESIH